MQRLPVELQSIILSFLVGPSTTGNDIKKFITYLRAQGYRDAESVFFMLHNKRAYNIKRTSKLTMELEAIFDFFVKCPVPTMENEVVRVTSLYDAIKHYPSWSLILERLFHHACRYNQRSLVQAIRYIVRDNNKVFLSKFMSTLISGRLKWRFSIGQMNAHHLKKLTMQDIYWFTLNIQYTVSHSDISAIITHNDDADQLLTDLELDHLKQFVYSIAYNEPLRPLYLLSHLKHNHLNTLTFISHFYRVLRLELHYYRTLGYPVYFMYNQPHQLHTATHEFFLRMITYIFKCPKDYDDRIMAQVLFCEVLGDVKKGRLDANLLKRVIFYNDLTEPLMFWKLTHKSYEFEESDLDMCQRCYSTGCASFLLENCCETARFDVVSRFLQPYSFNPHGYNLLKMDVNNYLRIEETFYGRFLPTMLNVIEETGDAKICETMLEMSVHFLRPNVHSNHYMFWSEKFIGLSDIIDNHSELSTRSKYLFNELKDRFNKSV